MKASVVGVAWYRREDYDRLRKLFADGDQLHETYDEWLATAERTLGAIRRSGQAFRKVYIDPDTFPSWCAARGLDIDARARARFAIGMRQDREID